MGVEEQDDEVYALGKPAQDSWEVIAWSKQRTETGGIKVTPSHPSH